MISVYKKTIPRVHQKDENLPGMEKKENYHSAGIFFLLISLLVLPLQKKLTASVARRREEEEEEEGNDKDRVKEFLGRAE